MYLIVDDGLIVFDVGWLLVSIWLVFDYCVVVVGVDWGVFDGGVGGVGCW